MIDKHGHPLSSGDKVFINPPLVGHVGIGIVQETTEAEWKKGYVRVKPPNGEALLYEKARLHKDIFY